MVTLREKYTKMEPNAHKKVRQQGGDLSRTLKDKHTTKVYHKKKTGYGKRQLQTCLFVCKRPWGSAPNPGVYSQKIFVAVEFKQRR